MSEILSPSVGENLKPFEIIKSLSQEKAQLQKEVVANQTLIKRFTDYITKNYSAEELKDVTGGTDINTYISSQILGLKIEDSIDHVGSLLPGAKDLLSVYKEGKKMFDEVSTMLGGSGPKPLIDEYIALRKTKPFELKKIEQWIDSHDISADNIIEEGKESIIIDEEKDKVIIPTEGSSELTSDKPQLEKVIQLAKSEIGTNEKDNTADKYFRELGYKYDSKKVPWCGAFVSWTLMKAGFPIPKNDLSAKAFINEGGLGHVGIKVEGKVVSGNYGNKVATDDINKPIKGYAIPTSSGLEIHKGNIKFDEVPEGAVVVFDRNSKRTQAA